MVQLKMIRMIVTVRQVWGALPPSHSLTRLEAATRTPATKAPFKLIIPVVEDRRKSATSWGDKYIYLRRYQALWSGEKPHAGGKSWQPIVCSKKAGEQRCGSSGEKVVYLGFVFSGSENTLIWRSSRYIYSPEPLSLRILPQCVNSVCKSPDFWMRKPILVHLSRLILSIIFRLAGSPRATWVFGLGEIQRERLFFHNPRYQTGYQKI